MQNGAAVDSSEVNPVKEDLRKVFVGGLSWDTDENEIKEYFATFGEIESVSLKKDPYTQKSRGFAFVLFKNPEPLEKVLDGSKHTIKGKKIEPNRAKSRPAKVFVGGLVTEITEDDIKDHFAQYGKVLEVEIPHDKVKNERKNFCFITFEDTDAMKEALKESKQTIGTNSVDVKKATPKPNSSGFGMMGGRGGRGGFRGRGRGGRGRFQEAWDYGSYGGYGYEYGGSQVAPPNTTFFDSSGNDGFNSDYYGISFAGGYGGGSAGGGKAPPPSRGENRPAPY